MARPAKILLVEDSAGDVQLTREAIEELELPVELEVARTGAAAIEYLDGPQRPDLIILDLNLPKMNGKEVLATIKSNDRLRAIPVIVLSTSMAPEDVRRCYDLYANCYVTKPTDLDEFLEMVRRIADFWLNMVTLAPEASQ